MQNASRHLPLTLSGRRLSAFRLGLLKIEGDATP
ncbi:hypothetical protein ACVWZ8_001972 [Arthrobacter sp. UYCu723]